MSHKNALNMFDTCDTLHVKEALKRAVTFQNGQIMFPNLDRSLRIFIRVTEDVDPPETYDVVELGIKNNSHTKTLTDTHRALVECGFPSGYYDDDFDVLIVTDIKNMLHNDSGFDEFFKEVKTLHESTVCPCGERLITDPNKQECCVLCHMTARGARDMCCICRENSFLSNLDTLTCCKKHVHFACWKAWSHINDVSTCPMCRAVVDYF